MQFLAFIEQDGATFGGFFSELRATVVGKSRNEVLDRLAQAGALAYEAFLEAGQTPPVPRHQTIEDLPEDEREDAEGLEAVLVELATINPVSVAIRQAIARSGLSHSEIARQMHTSPAAITRMTDLFYDAHSLNTLLTLSRVLNVSVTRFVGLRQLALDEFFSWGGGGMYAPGHVALKRTPELEAMALPALVKWEGTLFWLDAPAQAPYVVSDEVSLRFEGCEIDDRGYLKSVDHI